MDGHAGSASLEPGCDAHSVAWLAGLSEGRGDGPLPTSGPANLVPVFQCLLGRDISGSASFHRRRPLHERLFTISGLVVFSMDPRRLSLAASWKEMGKCITVANHNVV